VRVSPELSVLFLVVALACSPGTQTPVQQLAPGLSLVAELPVALVLRADEERGPLRRVIWESETDRLEVRVTSVSEETEATRLVADRAQLLRAVFVQPYSTHKLDMNAERRCPDHLRPHPLTLAAAAPQGQAYALSANADHIYGGCSSESSAQASIYANLYCPQGQRVYELRFFSPKEIAGDKLERLIASLRCTGS